MAQRAPSQPFCTTRRFVLVGGGTLALATVAGWPGSAYAATIDVETFLTLSQTLTGNEDLDAEYASQFLKAFEAAGKGDDLASLAAGGDHQQLANEVVAAWYTGVSPDPESEEVVTYTDALMWPAMSYTKPMGYCGGAMGYWADPPAT
ncbi:D-sorbitol dehydrogenase-like protein [Hoeflea halophila]|uniref:D-sorbitol dehydrogenase-like protein n=1 Tax=Hoeflea halophila TaxID=714899 RepID=A0A286I8G6_9HYPH|nr:sugar dehydrogenase complex small subunit [Hoeflea halophila]SOE16418.1 D-sorbitol dehydrogenase-like protein [Hoeflea halophila]